MAAEQCVEKKKGPLADDLVHQVLCDLFLLLNLASTCCLLFTPS